MVMLAAAKTMFTNVKMRGSEDVGLSDQVD
jgi:hypothetical protein